MLEKATQAELRFEDNQSQNLPHEVSDPTAKVISENEVFVKAKLKGPPGSMVIGRAWVSDEDGTIAESETEAINAGSYAEFRMILPESRLQKGDLITCVRIEWPKFQTKHVRKCILIKAANKGKKFPSVFN